MEATSKITALRQERGLTITKLGDLTGLQRRTIYAAERGDRVSMETMVKIASALEVPLAEIAPETAKAIEAVA